MCLIGNGNVTHQECASSLVKYILTGNAHNTRGFIWVNSENGQKSVCIRLLCFLKMRSGEVVIKKTDLDKN